MPPVPISLTLLGIDLGLRQQAGDDLQVLLPARQEQGIDRRALASAAWITALILRSGSSTPLAEAGG